MTFKRPTRCKVAAFEALRAAAFEERLNKDRAAADWWRERAAMWFRRAAKEERK